MGLFDMFKKKAEPRQLLLRPPSLLLLAPTCCARLSRARSSRWLTCPIPSLVARFWARAVLCGPRDDLVYAPCDGKVTVTMGHAVGLQSDSGIEVLVHVGVDTST